MSFRRRYSLYLTLKRLKRLPALRPSGLPSSRDPQGWCACPPPAICSTSTPSRRATAAAGARRHHARRLRRRADRRRRRATARASRRCWPDRRRRAARRGHADAQPAASTCAARPARRSRRGAARSASVLVGDRAEHEWAGDSAFRDVLDGLLGGVGCGCSPTASTRRSPGSPAASAGASRSRGCCSTAPELLLLDEPTNHLDVEGDRLARAPPRRAARRAARGHPRPLVPRRGLHVDVGGRRRAACTAYEGGYAAYVLARAERDRQEASRARTAAGSWCARSSRGCAADRRRARRKPKFRIDAANALIADEPPARDRAELLRFATSRLGDKVLDAVEVSLALGASDGAARADLAARAGRPRRARRRQRLGQDLARAAARRRARAEQRARRARRDRAARAPLPGHRRDPRGSARARVARGGPRPRDAERRRGDHRGDAVRALRLPRREGAHARRRPLGRRAPAAGG